jgi:hypothetical protein
MLSTKPIVDRKTITSSSGRTIGVAGSFPLMTQGWSFLDPEDNYVPRELFELRRGLLPSLWTTFRDTAGANLAALIQNGGL